MITTRYQVKLVAKGFDGISALPPDADFDSDSGFRVGYVLLVEDGTTWNCIDATVAAAVWIQDTAHDESIDAAVRNLTDILPRYLFNQFAKADDTVYLSSGADFTAGTIAAPGAGFDAALLVGDTIRLAGSRRNDGPYDVTAVDPDELEISPAPPQLHLDSSYMEIWPMVFPTGLQTIAARMAWYDEYIRPTATPGMAGEAVGSYSYSRMALVGGIEYPADLTAGLSAYKRPKIL
jgi:hypothetical protein